MRHGVIIACRMSSRRLPGKTLAPVAGRPLLWYVHRRLESLGVPLAIATSVDPSDDPIADYCRREGLVCCRGSLGDVAGRMLDAARRLELDAFARVNGDSPFVDGRLLRQSFRLMTAESLEFVTNLVPRTYPYGVAVELIRTETLAELLAATDDPEDREHVTRAIYRALPRLKHRTLVRSGEDLSHHVLTVDTPEDLERFRAFVGGEPTHWPSVTWEHAIEQVPAPRRAA